MAEGKTLRLLVHRLTDGQVAASVISRTWRGAEAWDRRLSPPMRLGTPPAAPPGFPPALWTFVYASVRLAGAEWVLTLRREAPPGAPGGGGGESAEWPIVTEHDRG